MTTMWPLREFRYDEGIPTAEVTVHLVDEKEPIEMTRADAIAFAHARGVNLVAMFSARSNGDDDRPWSCVLRKVSEPLRWEREPVTNPMDGSDADPVLWFDAPCGGLDLLVPDDPGHTFAGASARRRASTTRCRCTRWATCRPKPATSSGASWPGGAGWRCADHPADD